MGAYRFRIGKHFGKGLIETIEGFAKLPQIACQTETEAPNAQPHHESEGKEHGQHPIHAAMRKGRTRSTLIQHGHVAQHRKNLRRGAVVEIFHERFDVVGQAFCDFVRPMSEEKREIIRRQPEAFFAGIGF